MSCACSNIAAMLPQNHTMGATDMPLALGPLFPGQNLTCSTGDSLSTPPLQVSVSCMTVLVMEPQTLSLPCPAEDQNHHGCP